ncbi:hypothetical protein [Hymenobacter lucidus]|uniref:Lipocalin-like domain-containing protein n=1 Tax=Hymenobacter lucidus TaxID=2880930 RepID=A0ABS8AVU3_9BACT|nr:hypothetical protein [Hymenobacter lucidus]MCB2409741.1 hypothetical protein [Hymenobacter lucidus]
MPRLFALLLLCLTLLTASCKKDSTSPVPELEGRWDFESCTIYEYSSDDKLIDQRNWPLPPHYIVFSAGMITKYDATTNLKNDERPYTHEGNILRYPSFPKGDLNIVELTTNKLTLLGNKEPNDIPGHYIVAELKHTR